jgi:integrase
MESNIRAHIIPVLGAVPLRDLTVLKYQELLNSMMATTARGTRRNIISDLQSILNAARIWHKEITIPKVERRELYYGKKKVGEGRKGENFSISQARAIIKELMSRRPWNVFFPLLACSALRSNEILGLYVEDLDFEASVIHVRRGAWNGKIQTLKTDESEDDIPMPPQIKEMLQAYLVGHTHQLLFPNKLGRPYNRKQIVAKVLHPALDRLGIPHKGKRVGLHAFRHTLGSVLLRDNGVLVAQRQLRHKNASITLKNYGHILDDGHVEAVTDAEAKLLS